MDKQILIVGHGIAGCALAMTCYRLGVPFTMVGCSMPGEASHASSGLIAPITGRRYVKAWIIDELVTKAVDFYGWTEGQLKSKYFFPVEIARFLPHTEAKLAWEKRLSDPEYAAYVSNKKNAVLDGLNRPYGILTGGYRLDTPQWVNAVRSFLQEKGLLVLLDQPYVDTGLQGIKIFATGAVDPAFAYKVVPNKGESLVVRMPDWPITTVIKEEVFIIPMAEKDLYWIGSYYEPLPVSPFKTEEGRERLLLSLRKVYSGSLEVLNHFAGIRPTVNDRRPFVGLIPGTTEHYIFNGMGTKGTSLAPFLAEELILHITKGKPLPEEISPSRYIPEPVYKSLQS